MKLAAAHLPSTARSCAQRLLVTWVLLLAFTLQSYVTQTHFHGAASSGDRAPVVKILGQTSARGPPPRDERTIACPFCLAIVTAGAFFVPAVPTLTLLAGWADTDTPRPLLVGLAIGTASFSWRSRAPPQR